MTMEFVCATDVSGHGVGTFYVSNQYPIVYIPIMKNAHTWAVKYFTDLLSWQRGTDDCIRMYDHLGWKMTSTLQYHKKIVFLRNPISRWISGIIQYFYTHFDDNVEVSDDIINYLFSKIHFDEHTLPQVNFIHNLEINSIDFFYINDNLEHNLNNYLRDKIPNEYVPIPADLYKNKLQDKAKQDILLQQKLNHIITYNKNIMEKLQDFYKLDYELMNSIKFYGTN